MTSISKDLGIFVILFWDLLYLIAFFLLSSTFLLFSSLSLLSFKLSDDLKVLNVALCAFNNFSFLLFLKLLLIALLFFSM